MKRKRETEEARRLTSEELAELIVDVLVSAGIVAREDVERAVLLAEDKIEIQKSFGRY